MQAARPPRLLVAMGLVAAVRAGIAAPEVPAGLLVAVAALVPAGLAAAAGAETRATTPAAAVAWAFWEPGPTAPLAVPTEAAVEVEVEAAPELTAGRAPLAVPTAAAAAAGMSITRAEAAEVAPCASSGALAAATRPRIRRTFEGIYFDLACP